MLRKENTGTIYITTNIHTVLIFKNIYTFRPVYFFINSNTIVMFNWANLTWRMIVNKNSEISKQTKKKKVKTFQVIKQSVNSVVLCRYIVRIRIEFFSWNVQSLL